MNNAQTASQPRFIRPKQTRVGATVSPVAQPIFQVASSKTFSVVGDTKGRGVYKQTGKKRDNVVAAPLKVTGTLVDEASNPYNIKAPWPETLGITPNALIRSSLFGCSATSRERVRGRQSIEAGGSYEILYTGEPLSPFDLEVYALCCASARASGDMGSLVAISLREWNRALGKAQSGTNNERIHASLLRLFDSFITVTRFDKINGPDVLRRPVLVDRVKFLADFKEDLRSLDKGTHAYHIRISADMRQFFSFDGSELDIERVSALGPALQKWLHNFYSTHSEPYDLTLTKLRELSGTDPDMPMAKFRLKLNQAIEALMRCERPLFAKGTSIVKRGGRELFHVVKASNSRVVGPQKYSDQLAAPIAKLMTPPAQTFVDRRSKAEKDAAMQRARVAL
ncbi:plasmid replication initiator TrfA [Robbsia sp. Bb-Pol-6]|uniref:Plasmid replication initiator TrfA n=1 Tax=Robbsia betulipollinis TaxID=2981849 RepID=A0ABT3ZUL4_9BURK|nr:plasmid replication initiator TrfA [Robbsia betulipollinis]MCY0389910.1 plasmid replication initiator TrfA [Robbsia betulipollinis]